MSLQETLLRVTNRLLIGRLIQGGVRPAFFRSHSHPLVEAVYHQAPPSAQGGLGGHSIQYQGYQGYKPPNGHHQGGMAE